MAQTQLILPLQFRLHAPAPPNSCPTLPAHWLLVHSAPLSPSRPRC